jgi:oligoendopeptidase F
MVRILTVGLLFVGFVSASAMLASEGKMPETYSWNLGDLYATVQDFNQARQQFAKRMVAIDAYRGKLGASPATMKLALDTYFGMAKDLGRINSYASMWSDEDTRVSEALGARQEVMQLGAEFASRTSWIAPEILALPAGDVTRFLNEESALAPYRFFLEDLERQRAHTLSQPEEKLLAEAGLVTPAPASIYGIFANADMPFPAVTLSDGTKVRLDQSAYTKYRAVPNRADRILVFQQFWKTFGEFERTFGVALDAQVKRDLFYAKARKYPSCLAAALDGRDRKSVV